MLFVVVAKPLMNTALLRDFQFDVLGLWFPYSTVLNTSKKPRGHGEITAGF